MTDTDSTPLITLSSPALLDALAFPASDYGARFVDIAFWRPCVELIARVHALPSGEITMGEPGSFPTFVLGRSHVVKLFGEQFDGLHCRAVEREVARLLADAALSIPIPEVRAAGMLSARPDWRYLVTTFVSGEPFAHAAPHLDTRTQCKVAATLGRMLRPLHDLALPGGTVLGQGWARWSAFVAAQRTSLIERHRAWGTLPDRLLGEIEGFVAGYRVPKGTPSLVHADLHDHHLIGAATTGSWSIRGVIDWGDARLADRLYELPALHLGLFHGDRAMLRAFLEAYGWPGFRSDTFVTQAMAMTLLHEFDVLADVREMIDLDAITSLDDLATALWRV